MIPAKIPTKTRSQVYRRDGYRCALCDSTRYIQIHHAVPKSRGGHPTDPMNLITLCSDCHALAHGMDLRGVEISEADVEQSCVEYLADLYAPDWWPYAPGVNPGIR